MGSKHLLMEMEDLAEAIAEVVEDHAKRNDMPMISVIGCLEVAKLHVIEVFNSNS